MIRSFASALSILVTITIQVSPALTMEPTAELRRQAEQGDAEAQTLLGLELIYPLNIQAIPQNIAEGISWLQKAAMEGNGLASYSLGELYQKGEKVEKSEIKSEEYFIAFSGWAAKHPHGKDRKTSEQIKKMEANAYYSIADLRLQQCDLTSMYIPLGECGKDAIKDRLHFQDYAKALNWFKLAAERGNAKAQHRLGEMYQTGRGVLQDYEQAIAWYEKAARNGSVDAMFSLGMLHKQLKDFVLAHAWFNLASVRTSNTVPAQERDNLAAEMTPSQIVQAQKHATKFTASPTAND